MKPYNNPKVFLANPVKFSYEKEQKQYIPYILNSKIPVVFIPGYGYYTNKIEIERPLTIVDINNYNRVSTNRYYITNVKSIERYTNNPDKLLRNWYFENLKLNKEYGFDGKWYKKEDITFEKPEDKHLTEPDMKLDDNLYVAKLIYKMKKNQMYDGVLYKDGYIHVSNNYGLFTLKNGIFTSTTTGCEYKELKYKEVFDELISMDLDLKYSYSCVYNKEELGLAFIYDLHDFITTFHLYINPNKPIIDQINSYENLKTNINIRTIDELNNIGDIYNFKYRQKEALNQEIMTRTLRK